MPVIETLAAIFGGISALSSLATLFQKWRERRRKRKCLESENVEHAFNRVPRIIRDTCESCLKRAGQSFAIGDALASNSIASATDKFTRTLHVVIHLGLDGKSLDLVNVRTVVDRFGGEMVQSMGSLFTRVHRIGRSPKRNKGIEIKVQPSNDTTFAAIASKSLASRANSESLEDLPPAYLTRAERGLAISGPDFERISNSESLEASLDALRKGYSVLDHAASLQRDLEANLTNSYVSGCDGGTAGRSLGSWQLLEEIERRGACR